jgi:hypothetical protein
MLVVKAKPVLLLLLLQSSQSTESSLTLRECCAVSVRPMANSALSVTSVGTILGIDSQRLDSFGDFCGRARRLDSNSKNRFRMGHNSFALIGKKKLSQNLSLTNFARSSFKTNGLNFFRHILKVLTLLCNLCFCASLFS